MNATASTLFAEGFLKGYFDVIGAMLSSKPVFQANGVEDATAANVQDVLSEFPLMIQARLAGGGAVIVLTTLEDARHIVSAVTGEEPRGTPGLAEDETAAMKDIFDPCMGGGTGHFKEKYDRVVELEPAEIQLISADQSGEVLQVLGDGATVLRYSYDVPEIVDGGTGALMFSQALEAILPLEAATGEGADDAVQGIVEERFGTPEAPEAGGAAAAVPREASGNISMILDIALNVSVRLGRVEMPLGRVLELGPGSIIEVGHSVDDPVELLVNNKLIARGEVVVVEEKFGLRITEIVSQTQRIESLR